MPRACEKTKKHRCGMPRGYGKTQVLVSLCALSAEMSPDLLTLSEQKPTDFRLAGHEFSKP